MRTTDESYGHVEGYRQHEWLQAMSECSGEVQEDAQLLEAFLAAPADTKVVIKLILRMNGAPVRADAVER